jgi:hypothetical protein
VFVSPTVVGATVIVGSCAGSVYALDRMTNTALVMVGSMLVLGTADGYMNWLATASGEVKKRIRLEEGRPYGTPILAPPLLFVLTAGTKSHLLAMVAEGRCHQVETLDAHKPRGLTRYGWRKQHDGLEQPRHSEDPRESDDHGQREEGAPRH